MLTAVVPITQMAGKLQNLQTWLPSAHSLDLFIIMVHDHRDEITQAELEMLVLSLNNPKINLVSGKYGSPGAARNAGLMLCKSDLVCFWDSDDLPNLENVVEHSKKIPPETDILIGQYINFKKLNKSIAKKNSYDQSLQDIAVSLGIWRMVFRRKFLDNISFNNLKMGEDQVFFIQCLSKSPHVSFVNAIFYKYCINSPGQLTQNNLAKKDLVKCLTAILTAPKIDKYINVYRVVIVRLRITLMKEFLTGRLKFDLREYFAQDLTLHPSLIADVRALLFILYKKFIKGKL